MQVAAKIVAKYAKCPCPTSAGRYFYLVAACRPLEGKGAQLGSQKIVLPLHDQRIGLADVLLNGADGAQRSDPWIHVAGGLGRGPPRKKRQSVAALT